MQDSLGRDMQAPACPPEGAYDLVIVGAGPAGLSASIFARNKNLNTLILEADRAGGQLTALYPKKQVENFPAFVETTAEQFAQKLVQQALSHGGVLQECESAERILGTAEGLLVVTTSKSDYEARWVIVSTGMGRINPRRLGLSRESEFVGKGLFYAVLDPSVFAGKRALVVGGGDSAVDNALLLSSVGAQVLVAHRRPSFEAQPRSVSTLQAGGTVLLTNTQVIGLLGDKSLEGVRLVNTQTKEETALEIDALVINIGLRPELGTVRDWGLDMDGHFITVDSEMRTSRDGVFACGDAVCYPGKVRLVVTAIGEAAVAVNSVAARG